MKAAVLALLLAALLAAPARADSLDGELYERFGVGDLEEALPEAANEALSGAGVEEAMEPEGLLARLWDAALEALAEQWSKAAGGALKLVAVAALCALASGFADAAAEKYVGLAGCLAVAAVTATDAGAWIGRAMEAVDELAAFSRALLPCLTATAAAGGMAGSAAAKYAATSLFMDVLITLSRTLLLPMAYALLAVRTAGAALGSGALDGAARLIKWLCAALTTLVMTAFTLWLTLSSAVSGAADAAASRAAKTAISAALPVVGGIISDAASTLVAGAGLLRSAIGALGLAAVLAVCLAPFAALGLRYLLYKAAAALAGAFADSRLAGLISDIGGVFALALGVTGACAAMLFISVISFVKAVGA